MHSDMLYLTRQKPLPSRADVVIVGSGYTGLNAALECARGGRETVVLEAGTPGFGCSTRNGGQISTSIKPSLAALAAKHGAERAKAIRDEGKTALRWIGQMLDLGLLVREQDDQDRRRAFIDLSEDGAAAMARYFAALAGDGGQLS